MVNKCLSQLEINLLTSSVAKLQPNHEIHKTIIVFFIKKIRKRRGLLLPYLMMLKSITSVRPKACHILVLVSPQQWQ